MNKKLLMIACLPIFLPACQHIVPMPKSNSTAHVLSTYQWQNSQQNITLNFDQKQHLHIETGCNAQNTSWNLTDQTLQTSRLMSTMKMCSPEKMQQERFAQQLFDNTALKINIDQSNQNAPQLTLTNQAGQTFKFAGQITPEAQYNSQPTMVFFEVSPQSQGNALQVREIKYNDAGLKTQTDKNWRTVTIKGFSPISNTRNIIRVKGFNLNTAQPVYIYDMTVEQETL